MKKFLAVLLACIMCFSVLVTPAFADFDDVANAVASAVEGAISGVSGAVTAVVSSVTDAIKSAFENIRISLTPGAGSTEEPEEPVNKADERIAKFVCIPEVYDEFNKYVPGKNDPKVPAVVAAIPANVKTTGTTVTIPSKPPEADPDFNNGFAYTFKGWKKADLSDDKLYQPGDTVSLYPGINMFIAVWERQAGFVVTYNANGGQYTPPSKNTQGPTVLYSDVDTMNTYAKTSGDNVLKYEFKGWSYDPNGTQDVGAKITVNQNTTLYAIWKPVYKVILDANGGVFSERLTYGFAKQIEKTVYGNEPLGFFTSAEGAQKFNEYAHRGPGHSSAFDGRGTDEAHPYLFLGWSTDPKATVPQYREGSLIRPTGNMTLYAVWAPSLYTVDGYAYHLYWKQSLVGSGEELESGRRELKAEMIGAPYGLSGKLVIPEKINVSINVGNNDTITEATVTGIGDGYAVFAGYTDITEVVIQPALEEIGTNVFKGCTSLKTVTLNYNAESQLRYIACFSGCTALTGLYARNEESKTTTKFAVRGTISNDCFKGCTALKDINLEMVSEIHDDAFRGCTSLTKLKFRGLESLGNRAFQDCTGLKSVYFEKSLKTTFGDSCFDGCTSLEKVVLPFNSKAISYRMFRGCSSLKEIAFSVVMEKIEDEAFKDCTALTKVWYEGSQATEAAWKQITINNYGNLNDPVINAEKKYQADIVSESGY